MSSEPSEVAHIIAAGLQVLQGGRVKGQKNIIGASKTAAYDAVDDFLDDLDGFEELLVQFPSTPQEWQ